MPTTPLLQVSRTLLCTARIWASLLLGQPSRYPYPSTCLHRWRALPNITSRTPVLSPFLPRSYAGSSQVPLSTPRVLPTAAQLFFLPEKSGHAHPIYVCSRATLISLADCKNPTHSTWSPIAFLAGIEAAACSTCPPPAKHPHLGGGLSHGDPRRAPGAEF